MAKAMEERKGFPPPLLHFATRAMGGCLVKPRAAFSLESYIQKQTEIAGIGEIIKTFHGSMSSI